MIFLTYEPYTDNVEPKGNECFICYEYLLDNKYSKKMSSILEYCKSCDCDVYVHIVCLNKWFDIHKNCPICRKTITKNYECVTHIITSKSIFLNIFRFIVKYYVGFSKFLYLLFVLFLLYGKITDNFHFIEDKYYIDDYIFRPLNVSIT